MTKFDGSIKEVVDKIFEEKEFTLRQYKFITRKGVLKILYDDDHYYDGNEDNNRHLTETADAYIKVMLDVYKMYGPKGKEMRLKKKYLVRAIENVFDEDELEKILTNAFQNTMKKPKVISFIHALVYVKVERHILEHYK